MLMKDFSCVFGENKEKSNKYAYMSQKKKKDKKIGHHTITDSNSMQVANVKGGDQPSEEQWVQVRFLETPDNIPHHRLMSKANSQRRQEKLAN